LCGGMVIITFMVTSVRGETNQNVWLSLTVEENTHVLFFMNAQRMIVFRGGPVQRNRFRFDCASVARTHHSLLNILLHGAMRPSSLRCKKTSTSLIASSADLLPPPPPHRVLSVAFDFDLLRIISRVYGNCKYCKLFILLCTRVLRTSLLSS